MADHKDIRVHTKVDGATYKLLKSKCEKGGFRSIYQLIQTLLVGFCRYSDPEYDRRFADGMRKELDEMFEEMMKDVPGYNKSYTTDRRRRR